MIIDFLIILITGALLANQDNMEFNYKCNAFELYGADFLLSYDLKPWLIEINSSPALGSTTSVTNRMCAAMLEDIVRVTIGTYKNHRFKNRYYLRISRYVKFGYDIVF